MKDLFIVANWKSNKTYSEARDWFSEISDKPLHLTEEKRVIICPPFTLLDPLHELITKNNLSVRLGAQNVSPFGIGAFTGEINAAQIAEFAHYVLIGHSERRRLLGETDELIAQKVAMSLKHKLIPIFFMQDIYTPIPPGVKIVVYEPPSAISTVSNGVADTPDDVEQVASEIKKKYNISYVLYGGSVTPKNVSTFTNLPSIDGVVPGKASLDATQFAEIIAHA